MGIRKIEVKGAGLQGDEREFLFVVSATGHILHYEDLMLDREEVVKYVKNHAIPKDKHFDIDAFIEALDREGYVSVVVEKNETADYVAELFHNLV